MGWVGQALAGVALCHLAGFVLGFLVAKWLFIRELRKLVDQLWRSSRTGYAVHPPSNGHSPKDPFR